MKHIQTLTPAIWLRAPERRLRRMPDFLPERLQDQLRHCQPALREEVIFTRTGFLPGLPFTKKALPVLFM